MRGLLLILGAVFAMVFLSFTTPYEANAGRPFEEINKRLDDTNIKIDHANEKLKDISRQVHLGVTSGAKHWISPQWEQDRQEVLETGEYITTALSAIYILNLNTLQTASVHISVYNMDGNLVDKTLYYEIDPFKVQLFSIPNNELFIPYYNGWIEILSNVNVFVDGEIKRMKINAPRDTSHSSRTMTWYPVEHD